MQSITTILYKCLHYNPEYYITLLKLYFSRYEMKDILKDILSHSRSMVNKILSS